MIRTFRSLVPMPYFRFRYPLHLIMLTIACAMFVPGSVMASAATIPDVTTQPVTILLMGVDARPGDEIDAVGADIVAVLHLDPGTGRCAMLNIPRDTRVDIPGIGDTKLAHALMIGGVPVMTETVESLLGIDIDAYAMIDFLGAVRMIDALGGVTVVNDEAFSIRSLDFPAGELHLDGAHAVWYARYRGTDEGDFGRIHRQQQVAGAVMDAASVANPAELLRVAFVALGDHLKTDMTPDVLLALASTYGGRCTAATISVDTLPPASEGMMWDDYFGQELWFLTVDPVEVQHKVDALMGGD